MFRPHQNRSQLAVYNMQSLEIFLERKEGGEKKHGSPTVTDLKDATNTIPSYHAHAHTHRLADMHAHTIAHTNKHARIFLELLSHSVKKHSITYTYINLYLRTCRYKFEPLNRCICVYQWTWISHKKNIIDSMIRHQFVPVTPNSSVYQRAEIYIYEHKVMWCSWQNQ